MATGVFLLMVGPLLTVGVSSLANAHSGDPYLIPSCVNDKNGNIKIVEAGRTCHKNWTSLDWFKMESQGGSPFSAPIYDGGWIPSGLGNVDLFHDIGGNVDKYFVNVQNKTDRTGLIDDVWASPGYFSLTASQIRVLSQNSSGVRVRIWVYE